MESAQYLSHKKQVLIALPLTNSLHYFLSWSRYNRKEITKKTTFPDDPKLYKNVQFSAGGEREKKEEQKSAAGRAEHPCSSDGRITLGHPAAAPAESGRSSAHQIINTNTHKNNTCRLTEGSPWQSRWGWASRPLAKYREEEQFSLWVQLWGDTKREKVCWEDQWGRDEGTDERISRGGREGRRWGGNKKC